MTAPVTGSVPDEPGRPAVIIPAHDEEQVIGAGLVALLADAGPEEFDVVVVCNGCTDATAERAQEAADLVGRTIRVISTSVASKAAAIRAAEDVTTGFPRIYLDADVQCPTATARAMVHAVRGGAGLAVPRRVIDTTVSSILARAYYTGWQTLPWVQEQLAGRGAYAVSRGVRQQFDVFPDVVADDLFMTSRVAKDDAVIVDEPVTIRPPARLADVVRVRTRVYAGNAQLQPAGFSSRGERLRGLAHCVRRSPGRAPALLVFLAASAVAKLSAVRAGRRGALVWGRDSRRGRSAAEAARGPADRPRAGRGGATGAAVDVVILAYRSAAYIADSVRAAAHALSDVPGARVIVVDNDSGDDIADVVAGISERVQVVLRDVNDGFARGCHAGAQVSNANRLLFVNPDAVIEPGAVRSLIACAEAHPTAGIIGGRSLTSTGMLDPRSWWGRPTLWSALCFAAGLTSAFPGSRVFDPESSEGWDGTIREVAVVSGALMLVERDLWDALGGFDRDFFLYGEDVDLCLRARSAGWRPMVCPEAVFRHRVGASSAGSSRLPLLLRGKATTYLKNLRAPWGRVAVELLVLGTGLRALLAGLRRPGGRPHMSLTQWRDAWQRRGQWRRGWLPKDRPGDLPVAPTPEEGKSR